MPVTSSMRRVTPAQNPKRTNGSWKACWYVYWLSQPPGRLGLAPTTLSKARMCVYPIDSTAWA